MKQILLLAMVALFVNFIDNYSLPRFSLQQKDKCSSCHFNPTGGGMRNESGFYFGKNIVGMISPRDQDIILSPKLTENVSFGLDYRSQFLYSAEKKKTDFQDMTGSIYLNASIAKNIDVTARYDFVNSIWEAFGTAKILPNESYIKVGSFIPNYGIRLDDHTSYTRGGDFGLLFSTGAIQGLYLNPFYVETGLELGLNLSSISSLTASVGKSKFNSVFTTDPTYTARFEIMPSIDKLTFLLGGSFASAKTRNFGNFLSTKMFGGFAGIGYERFTIMGEYDIANDYIGSDIKSNALMVEASYQITVGLDAIVRYDSFDPSIDLNDDEHSHLVLGMEFFPFSFVEIRPQYRINIETPEKKNDALVVQFHFWY